MKNISLNLTYTIFVFFWLALPFFTSATDGDLLKQAYDQAQRREYAADQEWEEILWSSTLNISFWWFELQWPIISRIAQFMLRLVVILSIPMLLYSGITIMLAAGDSGKLVEALKHVWYVVLWVFIALASVMIVLLIISITNTNLWNI